jgi:glutamate synthase (NADPH/NADH) small chain
MPSILRRETYSDVTFLWEVEAPDVARAAQPGHFVMLRLRDGGERIPLTIADFDRERAPSRMVVQALGKTTREMLRLQRGRFVRGLRRPAGLPQHIDKVGHVVLVGGGLGVAPVFPQLRAFKQAGNRVHRHHRVSQPRRLGVLGGPVRPYCDELIVCTDDGSYGTPGFVTAALAEVCERETARPGHRHRPLPMMNACVETTRPFGVKTMVSLNAIMVDGTGMCGSCRVTVGGEVKFACVDGPDFDGHQVDFNELIARQRRFKERRVAGQRRLRPRLQPGEAPLRPAASATTRRLSDLASRTRPRCPSATRRARPHLRRGQPRLLAAPRAGRGRALHSVREADVCGRLPVAIDIPASFVTSWCATSTARWR